MYISTHANNNNSSVFPVFLYLWSYILVHLMTMSTRQKQFARFKTVWSLSIQSNQQKSQMPARNNLLAIHFMLHIKAPHYWSWRPYSRFLSPWQAGGWNMIEWKKKKIQHSQLEVAQPRKAENENKWWEQTSLYYFINIPDKYI